MAKRSLLLYLLMPGIVVLYSFCIILYILVKLTLLSVSGLSSKGCLRYKDVKTVTDSVSDAMLNTTHVISDITLTVIGTGAGVVVEIMGGEKNGRKCPKPKSLNNERWIESLDPGLTLADVVLPGAHHHGLVEGLSHYEGPIPGGKVLDWAVTQSIGVSDQLKSGARFLDIRLTKVGDQIFTAHGREQKILTLGIPFADILSAHVKFLKENKREFLVWNLQWEFGAAAWDEVEDMLDSVQEEYFYTGENPLHQSLSVLEGKIVICREGEVNLERYRVLECLGSWPYTMEKDPEELIENIKQYSKHPPSSFSYIEAVATIDIEGLIDSVNVFSDNADNLKDLACDVNKELTESLLTEENRNLSVNFHTVMVDFLVHHQVISGIMDFNRHKNYKSKYLKV